MSQTRIKFNNIVQNQLPAYTQTEFPLVAEFLKTYYQSQEYKSGPLDLIQNIDQYTKVSEMTGEIDAVGLSTSIDAYQNVIPVDMVDYPAGTTGFPESYGLLKIDNEIITYTGTATTCFTGCVRGFSGISSYRSPSNPEVLVFDSTTSEAHTGGSRVENLSSLFLKEFLLKTKNQLLPGLENRKLHKDLNQDLFIKQAKDFYLSKGTDKSFEILFKALYNEPVSIIKPREFLFTPSNANYKIANDFVVEPVDGDPEDLQNATLFQDEYKPSNISMAYAPVTSVDPIKVGYGQTYYKLSIDGGYDRDVRVKGSIYGEFTVHPSTKIIGAVSTGSTYIDVDSTVGFPAKGELTFTYNDNTVGIVSYTSKSLTQFFDCSDISGTILDKSSIGINTYVWGYSFTNQNKIIKVRIKSVLQDLDFPHHTQYYGKDDTARIKTLGVADKGFKASDWFYNISPIYKVKDFTLLDVSDYTYSIELNVSHIFKVGDKANFFDGDGGMSPVTTIVKVNSDKSVDVRGQGEIPVIGDYTLRRNILKAESTSFPSSAIYSTNVQNVYKDKDRLLVASSSIPSYNSQPLNVSNQAIVFTGTFSGSEWQISAQKDHGFYTGDEVYYSPERLEQQSYNAFGVAVTTIVDGPALTTEGLYFVKRINASTVQLAKSRTDISSGNFVSLDNQTTVTNSRIEPFAFRFKFLESQKLLREFKTPVNDGSSIVKTLPGFNGLLVNGVQILNYKSRESISYGQLDSIEILAPGSNYDVINPPLLHIKDSVGTGATGVVAVSGSLRKLKIIDPGFDYEETPTVSINGGNGKGAVASVNMQLIDHTSYFFADNNPHEGRDFSWVGIGTSVSTIGFGTYHRFRNAERVIYRNYGQQIVGGIGTDVQYYVSIVDNTTVKLHNSEKDAISGVSTVTLSTHGVGKQGLQSYSKKSVIEAVNVIRGGSNYTNQERSINPVGINTSLNTINIENHQYESGEIVKYTAQGTAIGGLTSGNEYYVEKVDNNKFKLSNLGVGTGQQAFFYDTSQYINLTTVGVGTHVFNYSPITVTLTGKVGLSSIGSETFQAELQPIFRGTIKSIQLTDNGVGYGSSEIIGFDRQPLISLVGGELGELQPIINNGKLQEVLVLNAGQQYNSPPNVFVNGDGVGAVVTPILKDGLIDSIKVIQEGVGYTQRNTSVTIGVPGQGAEFRAKIQNWRINLFERNIHRFSEDDGIIANEFNEDTGLQYSHLYAPRKLRESVVGKEQGGKTLYGKPDLRRLNGVEIESTDHSPIIGWAYDGNPIYGPYGYTGIQGGVAVQMKSGYEISLNEGRPPVSLFPEGFFVEDYSYKKVNDSTVLDENNGRFCVTPDFPRGTYAYFATIENGPAESSGVFDGYKRPIFPYLIGDKYQSTPNNFNSNFYSNQDHYSLDKTSWVRNTQPYNLIEDDISYQYCYIPDKLSQTVDVKAVTPGFVDKIGIQTSGDFYMVGDSVVFDNTNTQGSEATAKVSVVGGKSVTNISVATSSIDGVEIYPATIGKVGGESGEWAIYSDSPNQFSDNDIVTISGLSTTSSKVGGFYKAGITTNTFALTGIGTTVTTGIASDGVTGIVTYFNVAGSLHFKSIRENDILEIGSDKIKVLNVEPEFSRIRALRAVEGTTGAAHTATTVLYEKPRKITVSAGFKTTYTSRIDKEIYFNPVETVAIGTASGVGIGTTITFSNPGAGITDIFIPTKTLYIKNHGLETGDWLTYSPNRGAAISVQNNGGGTSTLSIGSSLYVAKIDNNLIGVGTIPLAIINTGSGRVWAGIASEFRDSRNLFFTGIGTGTWHSFKTNYSPLTGKISRNLVTVSTGSSHGLLVNDEIEMELSPSISTTFTVKYNNYNRRILIDSQDFVAVGVNTTSNAISITNHGYVTGQKVVHTGQSIGLMNDGMYYVVKVDDNTFKLADTHYNSTLLKPIISGITSAASGTISLINPPVKVYKDSTVIFDVSDSSLGYVNQGTQYSAFEMNFYVDKNLTQKWEKTSDSKTFEVNRSGKIGVDANATVTLTVNKDIPDTLYYNFKPLFESSIPQVKEGIIKDVEVVDGNEIQAKESVYNGKHIVSVASTDSFTYSLTSYPEKVSYASTTSNLKYKTKSKTAYGSISTFEVENQGRNYYSLPGITTVVSSFGKNSIVEAVGSGIGSIKRTRIEDIGYNFPSDTTLRPTVQLPQIVQLTSLASLKSIGITSVGRGYTAAPKLVVLDGKTQEEVKDIDLVYKLGDSNVTILKNTTGITNIAPIIIPTRNTNGVGISTVGFNTVTKDVSVTLSVGFSTANSFPFAVGDKVLVENISVGLGTTARGYNSAEYGYKLFELTSVDENLGGIGSVTYSLNEFYKDEDPTLTPGEFNKFNSVGRIIPQRYFPIFNTQLVLNDYIKGETVESDSATGIVDNWDAKVGLLKISTSEDFVQGEIIHGLTSDTQGVGSSIKSYNSHFDFGPFSKVESGWQTDSGFFNTNLQRIQDSHYYQNFSYSLKSKIPYETWDDVVSSLNHTIGHVKFSDCQIETINSNSLTVGLSTDLTSYEVVGDLIGYGDLNCFYDFDLVKENSLNVQSQIISDEIIFNSKILTDYEESIGNRVLSIDDVSGQFNSNPRATAFTVVSEFDLDAKRALKYFAYIKDRRFTGHRQLMIVDLIHDKSFGYINQYGRIETVYDLGSFDFSITGTKGKLLWYPRNYTRNDYDVTCISYNLDDNLLSVGTTSFGTTLIESDSTNVLKSAASTTIVGIASTYRSAKILLTITPDSTKTAEYEFEELNLIHDETTVDLMEYGQLTTTIQNSSNIGYGTYSAYISGSSVNVDYHPNTGIGTTAVINAITVAQANSSYSGIGTVDLKHTKLESRATTIASSGSPTANVIGQYPSQLNATTDLYDGAYFIVQISDTTNNSYHMSEFLVIDDYDVATDTGDTYDVEYGDIGTSGIGTLGSRVVSDANAGIATVQVLFTPIASTAVQTQVYMNALRVTDDDREEISFNNSSIETEYGLYTGTEKDIKRSFDLTHRLDPIFNRSFVGSSSTTVNVTNNTISLPNHFFVSGEKVTYTHAGAGDTQAIGCASTVFASGVTSTFLQSEMFVVKINEDKIKLSTTAAKSLKTIPEVIDLTSVGIGTSHRFTSQNQNSKVILGLDNIIQSPLVATAVTTTLADQAFTTSDIIEFTGITSFYGADLIKIGEEVMRIDGIGIGTYPNRIRVRREWLGTVLAGHSTGALVTKVNGNYNIVENVLNFAEAPYGNIPLSSTTNPPDDRDWVGISTGSSFQGRVFMRSGITNSSNETYYKNLIFDDISAGFNGTTKSFDLKSNGSNVTGIATENGVILVNDVFQGPIVNYDLNENAGVTSITFTGAATSIASDINTSTLPIGGVILSLGSTEGFGYQPLVAAGGTAVVSSAGTIQSINIGYSGSGYRSGIGQTVTVAIQTSSLTGTNITPFGTATIGSNGTLTGIAITNTQVIYKPRDVQNVGYNSITGITTITTAYPHGLIGGEEVNLSGIAFTCDYAPAVSISTVGYSTSTGIMTVSTYSAHGLSTTGSKSNVILTGLAFTCALDNGVYQHIYPRNRDRVFNTAVAVASTGSTTVTVNVTAAKVGNRYTHTFVGPGTEALITGGDYGHKFIGIAQSAVVSGGVYDHTFVSAIAGGVIVAGVGTTTPTDATYDASTGNMVLTINGVGNNTSVGSGVTFARDAITFTCSMDGNATNHAYPRAGDPITGIGTTAITALTGNTITVNVGTSLTVAHNVQDAVYTPSTGELALTFDGAHGLKGSSNHTISGASYNPVTGILTCTIANHGFSTGDKVKFADGSISFRCPFGGAHGAAQIKAYPRSTDYASNRWLEVTRVGSGDFSVNILETAPQSYTGIHTFTSAVSNGLTKAGESIRFTPNSLAFTCDMDQHGSVHTYPRTTDPAYNTAVSLGATGITTASVYVGVSTEVAYNVTAADYDASSGILTMTVGSHKLTAGDSIKFKKEGLTFTCSQDSNATRHKYPREGDPCYDGTDVIKVNSATQFEVNIGISTVLSHYTGIGSAKVQAAIIAPRAINNSPSGTDPASPGTNVLSVVDNYSFIVDSGVSTLPHNYARGGTVTKPMDVIIEDPLSYTNIPLDYTSTSSGVGTNATVDIVVGAGSSVTYFSLNNSGNGYGMNEVLTIPIGGTTGIPTDTSLTYKEFQLTVQKEYTDEFTGWSIGTLEVLDNFDSLFDGETVGFQLTRSGGIISIRSSKGSKINVEDVVLIFINDILQIPGKGYTFTGGSLITFTEAPKVGDTSKVIFYKGSGAVDVVTKEIIETVKKGDNLTIGYDPPSQKSWMQESPRAVSTVTSTDIVQTVPYYGPGNTEDENLLRPVVWCKQTEDRIIGEELVGKDRELYEANLNPAAYVLKSVGLTSDIVYVDDCRPFFDPVNETPGADLRATIQDKVTIINQDSKVGAIATCSITTAGTVVAVSIGNSGSGYSSAPTVTVKGTVGSGTSASATATITNGYVSSINFSNTGLGYTVAPQILISPPPVVVEDDNVTSYNGDAGIIVGFGTVGAATSINQELVFDFHIPYTSDLRNPNIVGTAITLSSIDVGDYFLIQNTWVGFAATSVRSLDSNDDVIGVSTQFVDNVYQVKSATNHITDALTSVGIGTTTFRRVNAKIAGISTITFASTKAGFSSVSYDFSSAGLGAGIGWGGGFTTSHYVGNYSWGKIDLAGRSENNVYPAYTIGGPNGISTGGYVRRTKPLRYKGYDGQIV